MSHVDSSEHINTVEWFFGYGGNHLGLKRVLPNLRLLAACEIEEFAVENILAKMEAGLLEAAPIWSDCKTFPWEPFVDRTHLFVASYPCQPFSAAGKRQGADDERHLWPYVHRWILRARPLLVFLENVEGHISLGLSTVISDLEEGGYKTAWGIFSASEVGAPHQRKRVFILAYRDGDGFISDVARAATVAHSDWAQNGISGENGQLAYRHGERGQLPDWWRVAAEQVPVSNGEAWRDVANARGNGGRQDEPWRRRAGFPSSCWRADGARAAMSTLTYSRSDIDLVDRWLAARDEEKRNARTYLGDRPCLPTAALLEVCRRLSTKQPNQ